MTPRAWIVVGAVVVVLAVRHRRADDPCALAQTWTAGDVHQYEVMTLSPDDRGHWSLGSYDQDVEPDAQDFSWQSTATTLSVTADGEHREVRYVIEPIGARCRLSLDASPLPRSHERTWYTGGL